MYFHEQTYDLNVLIRQNLHIHSSFSSCASNEMKLCDIVKTAEKAGLEAIAVTDHVHVGYEEQFNQEVSILRTQLTEFESGIKVYIGAELSAYGTQNFSYNGKMPEFDYRLWAQNHYHAGDWIHPEDKSIEGYKKHMIQTLCNLIKSGTADCIAHPFHDDYLANASQKPNGFYKSCIPDSFTDNEIGDLLTLGREHETAFEINLNAMTGYPQFCRRMYNLGKEAGVCFNIGTDAHKLDRIDTKQFLDRAKAILL